MLHDLAGIMQTVFILYVIMKQTDIMKPQDDNIILVVF